MHTVPIAAYTCAENRLWKVVTDIQTEFAPHFFFDIFCGAVMQPGICKKILDRLYTFALIRCCQFTENNSDRRFRVETVAVSFFMRSHLDQRVQNMSSPDLFCNNLFTVYAVHKTHNSGMFSGDRADALQCTR